MLKMVRSKADKKTLMQVAEDLDGYIKVVVDVEKGILSAGGAMHVDGEQLLMKEGSQQENLWGGGLDLETGDVDFDSMINIRPNQNNPDRSVMSQDIRSKMEEIIRKLL